MKSKGCLSLLGYSLRNAILIDLGILLVVGIICWSAGWHQLRQFFDGVFIAGVVAIIIGGVSILGSIGFLKNPEGLYVENRATYVSYDKRIKLMATEMMESESFMFQVGFAGLLLIAVSIVFSILLYVQ
jgi:hypothetical protein